MEQKSKVRIVLSLVVFIVLVVVLSSVSVRLWGEKPEKAPARQGLVFQEEMTVSEFGKANQLPNAVLKEVFGLVSKEDLQKKVTEFQYSRDQIVTRVNKVSALEGEEASKNWSKIYAKFVLWFLFLGLVFFLVTKRRITSGNRRWVLLSGVVLFGIILGSDPSPMGTIKDAIGLFAKSGVIFPPRMIALTLFLILVFVANKFICTWGCQFGTLQDFIFRLNRDSKDRKGILRQFKPSFVLSNTIRVVFLGAFVLVAFIWKMDFIEFIDPFKTFNPGKIILAGGIFVGAVSVASLFIYRPWCHFFCPFGLAGWIVEKKSLFKVKVDYDTCIACEACVKACPSTVMNAILKQDRVTPDCFSCATCIETCPTDSIRFESGRRSKPPAGKFEKKED
ncbi:MAG: 4Fe-4S ferredoxin [Deltaproteobacteria bacterium RBG_13_47_9]|nr:MAG: 4Fe-4S ferredoxin [Deltaproteobacteria bacterium RBG_13_47_9]